MARKRYPTRREPSHDAPVCLSLRHVVCCDALRCVACGNEARQAISRRAFVSVNVLVMMNVFEYAGRPVAIFDLKGRQVGPVECAGLRLPLSTTCCNASLHKLQHVVQRWPTLQRVATSALQPKTDGLDESDLPKQMDKFSTRSQP